VPLKIKGGAAPIIKPDNDKTNIDDEYDDEEEEYEESDEYGEEDDTETSAKEKSKVQNIKE
jgi:hypothetical protein